MKRRTKLWLSCIACIFVGILFWAQFGGQQADAPPKKFFRLTDHTVVRVDNIDIPCPAGSVPSECKNTRKAGG